MSLKINGKKKYKNGDKYYNISLGVVLNELTIVRELTEEQIQVYLHQYKNYIKNITRVHIENNKQYQLLLIDINYHMNLKNVKENIKKLPSVYGNNPYDEFDLFICDFFNINA